jgi:chemotaxis protein methyltransferase CheR
VLSKAREGVYGEESLSKIPEPYRKKYFEKNGDGRYQVAPAIRKNVTFKVFNLMDTITDKNKYDVIFCRNVMIYFNAETKINMVNKFYEAVKPEGYLMIGHAETIQRNQSRFSYVQPAIYKKE